MLGRRAPAGAGRPDRMTARSVLLAELTLGLLAAFLPSRFRPPAMRLPLTLPSAA